MRIACIISLLIFNFLYAISQPLLTRVYGGNDYDVGVEVIPTPDNGYLVAGQSSSFDFNKSSQVLLFKTDLNGYVEWRKTYGGQFADNAESMVESADGNLLISGFSETTELSYQLMALKLTTSGDTIWTRKYGGDNWDFGKQAVALPDSGFALFGQTYSQGNGEGDFYLVRIDKDGDTLWTRTYGGINDEFGESIALANDGGFFLAGHTESFGQGGTDMYVVRTDQVGDTLWTKTFGGVEDDYCHAIASTADGGYVLAGSTYNLVAGLEAVVLRKEGGANQWFITEPHDEDSYLTDVIVEPSTQNVTTVGVSAPGANGTIDGRIIRFGIDGLWNGMAKDLGGSETDRFFDVKLTSDGGYVAVGSTDGYLFRSEDVLLIKTNSSGFTAEEELGLDEVIVDGEAYGIRIVPNPIVDNTSLYIEGYQTILQAYGHGMILRAFNGFGQLLMEERIVSETQVIETHYLPNGVYYYQLVSGNNMLASGKMIKLNNN